ncbi:hypothetical protein J2S16_004405 [Cytobacillus kochii]|nr:hypothetical protein [Cytobacillus kochii]
MRYLGYLIYFIIATIVFYYLSRFVENQDSGSIGLILGNFLRGIIIVVTGYLVVIGLQRKQK